ncbi:hypothetical protein [Streptomyces fuscichromogenes]|uniref:Uncharacterized protein n=1 Tax=Streptomyces fuscichromogenes TaxID=1324013 RepID=A0A917XP31_9ACTN|nr:hypothetical protein [Streptomyces fuscichromogenes]GGN45300.1 hypothetical protein GCM10011578_097100 [Streptomyces fuscichromogenes]
MPVSNSGIVRGHSWTKRTVETCPTMGYGRVPAGGRVTFTIDKDALPNSPRERFDQALNVTLNSVIFRSSGQNLITTGAYTQMASRLLEPGPLALAVLAVRGRIKR